MSSFLRLLVFLPLAWSAQAAALDVAKIKGMPYQKARQLILKAGWHLGPKADYEVASKSVMKKYPEVVGCAMDRPVCRFAFLGSGNQCLAVFTEGEETPEFRVYEYSYECEKP